MTKALPVIFWIHSPIAYESFLAFSKTYTAGPVLCATSRGMQCAEALFELGQPGLYQHQSMQQIDASALAILDAIQVVVERYGQYALAVPQSAQPYIEVLIESPYCQGYVYYDEGDASYGQIQNKMRPAYHRYLMEPIEGMTSLCQELGVDWESLRNRHRQGVPFFNMNHSKYLGCLSFFADAFPGYEPTILSLPQKEPAQQKLCSLYSIVLLSDLLNGTISSQERAAHINNVNLVRQVLGPNVILKAHPSDQESEIATMFDLSPLMWSTFCRDNVVDRNQEVAFMGFKLYVSRNNSTCRYLRNIGHSNVLTIY